MARIAAAELLSRLTKGKPIPAVLLLGDEVYLRDTCRSQLIEKQIPEEARAWAVSRYSANRGDIQAALDQARTLPMLSGQQVVFLEDMEAVDKFSEEARETAVESVTAYLEDPSPFTTLVLEAASLDQRMKLAKLLVEKTLVVEVGLGNDEKRRRAAAVTLAHAMAGELGVKLEDDAADDLAESVADDLMRLKTEVEKLAAYAGNKRQVRREDVSRLVVSQKTYTVWQFADMIAARQGGRALEFLDALLRDGEEPVALVGAMAWMFRKLIEASEVTGPMNPWQAARLLGMRPDAAELALQNARKMPRKRLLENLSALRKCDDRLKRGNANPRAILEFLVAELTEEKANAQSSA